DIAALEQRAGVRHRVWIPVPADEALARLGRRVGHRYQLELLRHRGGNRPQHRRVRAADQTGANETNPHTLHAAVLYDNVGGVNRLPLSVFPFSAPSAESIG